MTKEQKRAFTNTLIDRVRKGLLAKIDRVPATWDGVELRQWILDEFKQQSHLTTMSRPRRREYVNTVLGDNL